MEKQTDILSIELGELSLESVAEYMGYGNNILFVTENKKLIGAVTEGDIKRYFRRGKSRNSLSEEVVNRNISCLVEKRGDNGSSQVWKDAESLFREKPKIHNIPVVDENGGLLYQINRTENVMFENIKKDLTGMNEFKALPIFLSCEKVDNIVIAGGNKLIQTWVKEWFEQHIEMSKQCDKLNIKVLILEGMREYQKISSNSVIICLSDIVLYYLRLVLSKCERIFAVREITQYYFYKKLGEIRTETIVNYFSLFGYDKICIQNSNFLNNQFVNKIKECGITVIDKIEKVDVNILQTQILLYSLNERFNSSIIPSDLYTILYYLETYHFLVGNNINKGMYIQEYLDCLKNVVAAGYYVTAAIVDIKLVCLNELLVVGC